MSTWEGECSRCVVAPRGYNSSGQRIQRCEDDLKCRDPCHGVTIGPQKTSRSNSSPHDVVSSVDEYLRHQPPPPSRGPGTGIASTNSRHARLRRGRPRDCTPLLPCHPASRFAVGLTTYAKTTRSRHRHSTTHQSRHPRGAPRPIATGRGFLASRQQRAASARDDPPGTNGPPRGPTPAARTMTTPARRATETETADAAAP